MCDCSTLKFLLTYIAIVASVSAAPTVAPPESPFPSYIKVCPRDDNAWTCVVENIERCRPHIAKGIPKLAVPSLTPFLLPRMEVKSKEFGIVLLDLKVYNLETMKIIDGAIDFDNYTLRVEVEIPFFVIRFRYEASGSVLMINFQGDGMGVVNASNINIKANMTGLPIKKNGVEYINFFAIDLDYKAQNGTVDFPELFGKRQELTKSANNFLNDNFDEFAEEIRPYAAKSISELLLGISKSLFHKYPYDVLFPKVKKP